MSEDFSRKEDVRETQIAAVAFCADKCMEAPLHVAASTLLRNLRADYTARLYFLLSGYSARDIAQLQQTLDRTGREFSMRILEPTGCEVFSDFPRLHGSTAIYHRLLLPGLVQEDRLLYLDSDIRVALDVAPLFKENMGDKAAGFVISGEVRHAIDWKFQTSIGRPPHAPMFNSGVCLFNLQEWHRQDCSNRLLALGAQHRAELTNNDQSLLNAFFADDCYRLDSKYNVQIKPGMSSREVPSTGILHFVGSPKPWDIGARWLLPYAKPYFDDLRKTAVPFLKRITWLNAKSWARLPRILGGYRRALRNTR